MVGGQDDDSNREQRWQLWLRSWHQWLFHLIFVSVELSGLVLELHGIIELLSLFSTDNYPALIREQFWVITEIWWLTLSEFRVAETRLIFGQLQSKHGQCICRAEAPIPFCQIPSQAGLKPAGVQSLTPWLWRWMKIVIVSISNCKTVKWGN